MVISTKFTHADLLLMPNDDKRREIVDGELYVTPSPKFRHQAILTNILGAFLRYLEHHPIGRVIPAPMDVILSDLDVVEPDLLFVLNEHRDIFQDWVRGAPDLVVEILSPTTASIDRGPKLKAYARFRVPQCWLVDPDRRSIEIYEFAPEGYRLSRTLGENDSVTSTLLPEFSLAVSQALSI